jgi:rsbT co-antagonist protein RsbR
MPLEMSSKILEVLEKHEAEVLAEWIKEQIGATTLRPDLLKEGELRAQCTKFIKLLREAILGSNIFDIQRPHWTPVRDMLGEISRSRALQGFSASETATFVFSIKQPIFARLRKSHDKADSLAEDYWNATVLFDKLGLYTAEMFQKSREEIIGRQQQEMFELSAPVVELWQGILALPVIGTLDSKRTQLMLETLLERVAATQAEVAIVDITGVPAMNTLTAQHLINTVNATRLMGAECLISGVRPQIAQTMVGLGVSFADVVTKSTIAGALAIAFKRRGLGVRSLQTSEEHGA